MRQHELTPAAQYLRMSTDQQQYSLVNQAAAIARYAELRTFKIVRTYEDAGRSGLVLRERPGLRALLRDVIAREVPYKAILVYDVSRWGRFQDSDESAAYEYICKSAGVPVHYCAEQFDNDSSISSSVMKALKRAMAAEYSRELGVKSYEGQKRLAQLGFKMGGSAGYGLQRMMVSASGARIRVLQRGEYKAISTNRVVLVPGPRPEIATVRRIYSMALLGKSTAEIVRELNRSEIKYIGTRWWTDRVVSRILTCQKYAGWNIWGQTSQKLHDRHLRVSRKDWVAIPGAFPAIIDQDTFDRVQKIRANKIKRYSDTALLSGLKRLWRAKGYLSEIVIDKSRKVPCTNTYYRRFGSLRIAYQKIGYLQWEGYFQRTHKRERTEQIYTDLMQQIASRFPGSISLVNNPPKRRRLLLVNKHILVSVYLCRYHTRRNGRPGWRHDPVCGEKHNITLLCTLNASNDGIRDYYLFRTLGRCGHYKFGPGNKWLKTAKRLKSLSELYDAIVAAARA